VIQEHEAVAAVAVFGVPDDYYGEIVAAAVKPAGHVAAADLRRLCDGRIAKFKVPARFYRVDAFPLTPSGKIRKVELRQWEGEGRLEALP
jgi:fatty-acyl-CoA synthase